MTQAEALERIGLIVAWGGDEKSARIREIIASAKTPPISRVDEYPTEEME